MQIDGFRDALDLVFDYIERCKDNLPEKFVMQIRELIQNARDKRILELKKEFLLTDSKISVEGKKTKR